MSSTFKYICDPGHGWLQVANRDVIAVGLHRADFSPYSYAAGRGADATLYLEEDCDMPKFIEAYSKVNGAEPRIERQHSNAYSFVRGLRSL